ncbi:MAG TPA: CUAEP/CCAEP-tail radical SAM protein, partial [Methylomirabilota bacterium]
MHVLLLSTYELGRQPFGLASPAAWLREAGLDVACRDLSRDALDPAEVRAASLVALHVPMHTATRLALPVVARLRELNPSAHLCAYGLYAPPNDELLRSAGIATVLGPEFEADLVSLAQAVLRPGRHEPSGQPRSPAAAGLPRLAFRVPDRTGLPDAARYASVTLPTGERRPAGYTEASRGCKHLCRHCPVVPVYGGHFRVVPADIVLADIGAQVARGVRHVTFGDPDFFNGIAHARR